MLAVVFSVRRLDSGLGHLSIIAVCVRAPTTGPCDRHGPSWPWRPVCLVTCWPL